MAMTSKEVNNSTSNLVDCPSILLVDDDLDMLNSIERSFRPWNINLNVALHGMQGIMEAMKIRPDVIVTDLQMPFASGEELIDCLSRNEFTRGIPIIVVTGRWETGLTSQLESQGVTAVLQKPFDFDELIKAIGRIIPMERSRSKTIV